MGVLFSRLTSNDFRGHGHPCQVGHGVDHYLEIVMPRSMKGWWKKWFYMKNDDSAMLPVFTCGRPIPLPSWGEGAAGKDLGRIQRLRVYLQQLRQVAGGTKLACSQVVTMC
jgi:hypothetical protein